MSRNYLNDPIKEKVYSIFTKTLNEDILGLEKNDDSSDGNVYNINCKNNKYIAKVYCDKRHASSMVLLHRKLYRLGLNVPNIIYDNLNEESDKYIVIYSFINGKQITDTLRDGKVRKRNNIINFQKNKENARYNIWCKRV